MKKFYMMILFVLITGSLSAQFDITSANMPAEGDIFVSYELESVPDEGFSGTGQIWDFSTITKGASVTVPYVDPAQTPYDSFFPSASLAAGSPEIGYFYYVSGNDEFSYLGMYAEFDGGGSQHTYSDYRTIALPIEYGTTHHDHAESVLETFLDGGGILSRTYRKEDTEIAVDGNGTMHLPGGILLSDVNRVKTVRTTRDSIPQSMAGFYTISVTTTENYEFYGQSSRYPILNISYSTVSSVSYASGAPAGQTQSSTEDAYYHELADVTGLAKVSGSSLHVYPNPAKDVVTLWVEDSGGPVEVVLKDISGRVQPASFLSADSNSRIELDVSSQPVGIYFLEIYWQNVKEVKKLIIEQ